MRYALLALAVTALAASARTAVAQAPRVDTLYLDALQRAAESRDTRAQQLPLIRQQTALRTQNINSERRPNIGVVASSQYLSDVAALNVSLPGNVRIPTPYNTQYDSYLTAREPIYDPTRGRRANVEAAQAGEAEARVHSAIFQQRQQVNDAFFALQLVDAQQRAIDNVVTDLTARRKNAESRVAAGASLPSETLLLDAELTKRHQARMELDAQRTSLRELLFALTGITTTSNTVLAMRGGSTSSDALPSDARPNDALPSDARGRPEFLQFDRARRTLDAKAKATAAQDLPRISLIGRAGYGRPGLNALGRSFDSYWTAGVQLEWTALNWGRTDREVEAQRLQRNIVTSDEQAFTDALERAAIAQRGQIRALEQSAADDDTIVALRQRVLQEMRLRFDEGEVTSADYVARLADATAAQLDRDTRRIRLSEARARYLTTIGREVR